MRSNFGRASLALGCALVTLAGAPSSRAESPSPPAAGFHAPPAPAAPSAADALEARRISERAGRLASTGLFSAAAAAFTEAYTRGGRPADLVRAADAYREGGSAGEAITCYREALARHEKALGAAEKLKITKRIAEVEAGSGVVTVTSSAPGVTLEIDDKPSAAAVGAPLRLSVGSHIITATAPGYLPFRQSVNVTPRGTHSVAANLEPDSGKGTLAVREKHSEPMQVFLDGAPLGPAPFQGEVEAGPHKVSGKGARVEALPVEILVPKRKRVEVELEGVVTVAKVSLRVAPDTADIALDGKTVGRGTWEGEVPYGKHEVSFSARGYVESKKTLDVVRGELSHLAVDLVKAANIETPAEAEERRAAQFRGMYGGVGILGTVLATRAPDCGGILCDASTPVGGGLAAHVGYTLGYVGIQATAIGFFDGQSRTATGVGAGESDLSLSFGGFGGVGVRGTTRGEVVRGALSMSFGPMVRSYLIDRKSTGALVGRESQKDSTVAPALAFDLGVQLGGTPGSRLLLALFALAEFRGALQSEPFPNTGNPASIPFSTGPAFYLGPKIGVEFGH